MDNRVRFVVFASVSLFYTLSVLLLFLFGILSAHLGLFANRDAMEDFFTREGHFILYIFPEVLIWPAVFFSGTLAAFYGYAVAEYSVRDGPKTAYARMFFALPCAHIYVALSFVLIGAGMMVAAEHSGHLYEQKAQLYSCFFVGMALHVAWFVFVATQYRAISKYQHRLKVENREAERKFVERLRKLEQRVSNLES